MEISIWLIIFRQMKIISQMEISIWLIIFRQMKIISQMLILNFRTRRTKLGPHRDHTGDWEHTVSAHSGIRTYRSPNNLAKNITNIWRKMIEHLAKSTFIWRKTISQMKISFG